MKEFKYDSCCLHTIASKDKLFKDIKTIYIRFGAYVKLINNTKLNIILR